MGAWGEGPFDNDDALDWVFELEEATDWSVVETALQRAADVSPNGYLDAPVGNIAWAAAAVVAAVDDPTIALPDEVSNWLGRFGEARPEDVCALGLQALRRVLEATSELADLWREVGEEDTWRANVEKIAATLRATGVELPSEEAAMARRLGIPVGALTHGDPASRDQVAGALIRKGFEFAQLGRHAEALEIADLVIERIGNVPEPALRQRVASALVNKGFALNELHRPDDAIEAFNLVIDRYGDAPELALRERVAKALLNKGLALHTLDRADEEIEVYDLVLDLFSGAPEPALHDLVARALHNKGSTLGELGRSEEAIDIFDRVVERFGAVPEPALLDPVARALVNKGYRLAQMGRSEEATELYDLALERLGEDPDPDLRELAARTLILKGVALGELGRSDAAIDAYELLVDQFGEAPERRMRAFVHLAKRELARLADGTEEQS